MDSDPQEVTVVEKPKRMHPCPWCGEPRPAGWENPPHRCAELDQAMADLRAAAGVDELSE